LNQDGAIDDSIDTSHIGDNHEGQGFCDVGTPRRLRELDRRESVNTNVMNKYVRDKETFVAGNLDRQQLNELRERTLFSPPLN
jgi:hypothetical protein